MARPDNPHFSFPFRLSTTGVKAVVHEQNSDYDIMDGVEVLLSTELGERLDDPDYGIEDQAFREGGADLQHIAEAISRWEPRVPVNLESTEFVTMVQRIRVGIRGRSSG